MSARDVRLEVIPSVELSEAVRAEIVELCDRAYRRPTAPYFATFHNAPHVVARLDGVLVSHAMWVTRWLQAGSAPLMRTAYVEMVATDPSYQRRGYGSDVMRRLVESITDYDLGALCPSDDGASLYPGLGWEYWRGPLFIRGSHELVPTPHERVMVLRLPRTPALDLDALLTAEWREGDLW